MVAHPRPIAPHQPCSPAEYLAWEVTAETRHEYRNGEIYAMTGGTPNHNRLIRNLCTALTLGLRGQDYEVFVADQRLWIPEVNRYTYPDVMVIAGELVYQPGRRDTVMNPWLIVEVLSEFTRDYDRGEKFAAYRTLPSFQAYLLVDQYAYQVESHTQTAQGQWVSQTYEGLDTDIALPSLNLLLPLADLYDRVSP